jgi:hypothetical protein
MKKKIIKCDFCKVTKNPAYQIVERKTSEIVKRVCKNCMSNIDKVYEMLEQSKLKAEAHFESGYNDGWVNKDAGIHEDDIPF